ncbi:MAG: AvrD family protein [Catenulispora sp.]
MAAMTETGTRRRWASVEDLLGPAERRFFGSGYRRIGQSLRKLTFDATAEGRPLSAVAAVTYPRDWSRKRDDVILRPHLSTIDALIFGARLAEHVIADRHRLSAVQRASAWLRRVEIKAGSRPDESGLDALPAGATLLGATAEDTEPGRLVSTVECRVGAMTMRVEIDHDDTADGTAPAAGADPAPTVYHDGYRLRTQALTSVELADDALSVRADAVVEAPADAPAGTGLESAYDPSVSLIDAFVVALQLGQVMLYRLDDFDRGTSNTLWMRKTVITTSSPHRPADRPYPVAARLADPMVVRARGGSWRTGEIVCDVAGVLVRCAVTHQLPTASA